MSIRFLSRLSLMLLLACWAFARVSASGSITVSQSVSSPAISYNDSLVLELVLSWEGPQIAYRFPPLQPQLDRLSVKGFSTSVSTHDEAGIEITRKLFRYTLVPTSGGVGRIEPIAIDYLHFPDSLPGQLMTEPMTVQIGQPPERPTAERTPTLIPPPVMVALLVTLAIAIAFVIVLIVRNRRPKQPVVSLEKEFLQKLGDLKQEVGNDVKRFQTGVYKLLVQYLASKHQMSLAGLTTEEMVHIIDQSSLPTEQREKIGAWMLQAQRQKFSPLPGEPGEVVRLEGEIRALFEKIE